MTTKTIRIASLIALCGMPLIGCVSVGEYDLAADAARTSQMRVDQLVQDKENMQRDIDAKNARLTEVEKANRDLMALSDEMKRQLDQYNIDLKNFSDRINGYNIGAADPLTNAELESLAAQYPDLMTYDSVRGMIRLAADLTFDSGSDVVKEPARQAIGRLAGVLNGENAGKYDIRIVGHTDRQPISNAATRAKFGTNRVLSCFRAISVEKVMAGYGVATNRIECSGWGEFQPAVEGGALNERANRRVEIFLVPPVGAKGMASPAAAEPAPTMKMQAPAQPVAAPVRTAPKKEEMPFK